MSGQRGFALLVVLWTMGLLALLVAQFTATARTEVQVAGNLRANAVTQAAADGAVHEAVLRLLQGTWAPDGRARAVRIGDAVVEVRIKNQSWKVNPNSAPLPILQALLGNLGVDAGKATALSRAIVDWRSTGVQSRFGGAKLAQYQAAGLKYGPANQHFDTLDEVGLVVGMTPAILARIKPFMSIYQESDALEQGDAMPTGTEEAANRGDGWQFGSSGRTMVAMIETTAIGAKSGRFTRQAVVRLHAEASLDQTPYQILTWDTPSE